MSATREIITFQLGHYANFVGAHWWNVQESSFVYDTNSKPDVNHDVMFREGLTQQKESTYLPRLIAVDLKGSLNTLKQDGLIYEPSTHDSAAASWMGEVGIHSEEPIPRNKFLQNAIKEDSQYYNALKTIENSNEQEETSKDYNLDDNVYVWSDFLRVHYHPKTTHLIQKYQHNNVSQQFDAFVQGQTLFSEEQQDVGILDKLHFFAEECDQLQGFHVLFDVFNGFGGYGSELLTHLHDEYPNKAILTVPLYTKQPTDRISQTYYPWLCNSLMSLINLQETASAIVPMSTSVDCWDPFAASREFPQLSYRNELAYHTSAPLAVAIDTITLPYRLKSNTDHIHDITDTLTAHKRKFLISSVALPLPITKKCTLYNLVQAEGNNPLLVSLTPHCEIKSNPIILQSIVCKGIPSDCISRENALKQTVYDVVGLHLNQATPSAISHLISVNDPCVIKPPFPNIISDPANQLLNSNLHQNLPIMAGLHNSPTVVALLSDLSKRVSHKSIQRFYARQPLGLEMDDFQEAISKLNNMIDLYNDPSLL